MRAVEDIIDDWKAEFGTMAYGKHGQWYRYISWKIEKNLLLNLAQTLIDEGYKKEDLVDEDNRPNAVILAQVVNGCSAPEGASSRKKSDILKSKRITANNWKEVLKEFFRGPVSTHIPEDRTPEILEPVREKFKPKATKIPEVDPKDRIKMDTSEMPDIPMDEDFLNQLGVTADFFSGPKDE